MFQDCDFFVSFLINNNGQIFCEVHISSRYITSILVPGGVFLPFMSESLTDLLAMSPFLPLLGRVFVLLMSSEIIGVMTDMIQ